MMHVLIAALETVAAFFGAALIALFGIAWVALISKEVCGSMPALLAVLVRLATLVLPQSTRGRYREEWAADLRGFEDRPISGLLWAIDCFRAAFILAWPLRQSPRAITRLVSSARTPALPQQIDRKASAHLPTVTALGSEIAAAGYDAVVEWIGASKSERRSVTLVASTVSTLMLPSKVQALRGVLGASSPILLPNAELATHLRIRGYGPVTHLDPTRLMPRIFKAAVDQGWRIYIYGGSAGDVADRVRQLRYSFPKASMAGAHVSAGPLDAVECADTVDRINRARADFVWISFPYGAQIRWLAAVRDRLQSPVVVATNTSSTSVGWQVSISRPRLRAIYRASPVWIKRALAGWSLRWAFSEAMLRERRRRDAYQVDDLSEPEPPS
jgi:UDP-N-acetyl-D-mannosaminuronic acid transferase (WecB/TagA/CpsF family)